MYFPRSKQSVLATIAFVAVSSLILSLIFLRFVIPPLPQGLQATYVGRSSCVKCHETQVNAFALSHHDCAMQEANHQTVLGNFDNMWIEENGQRARFFRDRDEYLVETADDKGVNKIFKIEWTFGIQPLQQYMVNLDSADASKPHETTGLGRIQVLRWSWDTENKRWFHLDPPDVHGVLDADDELAWTGPAQRWNNMCAACHSTNLIKGFDVAQGRYHTRFAEIDVSCESCHGPASIHLKVANRSIYRKDPVYGHGLADLKVSPDAQIESCAPCHSRRTVLSEGYQAGEHYADYHSVSLLDEGTYFDDGQVLEEDYVYGSFIQSKMYHKGIRCSDCHDPHTARLKFEGNQVCTSCHQHPHSSTTRPRITFTSRGRRVPSASTAICQTLHTWKLTQGVITRSASLDQTSVCS